MKNKIILLVCALTITFVLVIVGFANNANENNNENNSDLAKIITFSVSACSACGNTDSVTASVKEEYPYIEFALYNAISEEEVVNQYNVVEHPTVIFLNSDGKELKRIEKEVNFEDYMETIEYLLNNKVEPTEIISHESQTVTIPISVFAVNKEDGSYVELSHDIEYNTQVRYHRIAAIESVLSNSINLPEYLMSPIPEGIELININNMEGLSVLTLSDRFDDYVNTEEGKQTEELIALALLAFEPVEQVQILTENYTGEIITTETISDKIIYNEDS